MPRHIERAQTGLAQARPATHKVFRGIEFFDQVSGNFFARLVVTRHHVEGFFLIAPVFLQLRRQFDKIPQHIGAGLGRIGNVGEQAMHGVTHFVEQREDFIMGQQ